MTQNSVKVASVAAVAAAKFIRHIARSLPALMIFALGFVTLLMTPSAWAAGNGGGGSGGGKLPPEPPSNLSASAVSSSQIDLSWQDNAGNESGFIIQRAMSSSGPWTQIATVAKVVISYSNTGLTASTTCFYRVCAYNSKGNSAFSNTSSATTLADSCLYSISPTGASCGAGGSSGNVSVVAGANCHWNASSSVPWMTTASSGMGNGMASYTVGVNPSASPRTGTLSVAGQMYSVTHDGVPCAYSILPTSASLDANGGAGSVSVTADAGCSWTAS